MDSIGRVGYLPRVAAWVATIPEVDARLQAQPPARVADIACGAGRAAISVASAYPGVVVDGFDLDPASIELARGNLAGRGLDERVRFEVRDINDPALAGQYDLATMFDALHDMAYPVPALGAIRRLLAPGGSLFVGDGKTAERFTAPGDQQERMTYTASILHCLPVGLAYPDGAGTGAAMRPETVRRYAADAGFASVEIVPIDDEGRRFYRLRGDA
jgi:SAM-dependent methyltransferase